MRYWVFWGIIAVSTLATEVSAQQGVRWQEASVESARRRAAQTGRLVLVHFWSPSCPPCRNMERNVFSQPQVAAAIEASYVPVKINADHFPHTCREYGVTALPTDLILTSAGQPVRKFQGEAPSGLYITRLNEVAAMARRGPPPGYALGPAAGAPQDVGPGASRPAPPRFDTPNWGAYANDPQTLARPRQQPPELAQAAPRYEDQPIGSRPPGGPLAGRQPEASLQRPSFGTLAAKAAQTPPGPAAGNVAPPAAPPSASSSAPRVPEGNPPVGLDGYCPVQLCEKQRWVVGNRRWGAIHRGRTYLFAGPDEQRRFLADPDRYAPVISGDDVVLTLDRGQHIAGRRRYGVFYGDRVYLFASEASLEVFKKNPRRYAEQVLQTMRPGRGGPYR